MGEACRRVSLFFAAFLTFCGLSLGSCCILAFSFICGLDKLNKPIVIGVGVAAGISVLLFIFAIYASCCGARKSRVFLGITFILFALTLVTLAICLWIKQTDILDIVAHGWDPQHIDSIGHKFETKFNCKGWDGQGTCQDIVCTWLRLWSNVIGGVSLLSCVIASIGAFISLDYAYLHNEEGSSSRNIPMLKETLMISRGW